MKALFAGSFDPFTTGHLSIVRRALSIFEEVAVGIGVNGNKPGEWDINDRLFAIRSLFADEPRVSIGAYTGLTAEYARTIGAGVLIRGIRSATDLEYERNLADTNRDIFGIDTLLLVSDPALSFVSSSMVRELIHHGVDASKYIAGDVIPQKMKTND